ncbi:DUF4157 domain-containing protein [Kitasatospora sp. NPDC127116]|uniref:eCIS core domain-containing protein n=1 Tax=Kitasatospora sp. NPDC127116 TaxID=3345367 RepID=UPI003624F032
MRAQERDDQRAGLQAAQRTAAPRRPAAEIPATGRSLLALQASVGNAAVVQMMRRGGVLHAGHLAQGDSARFAVQRSTVFEVLRTGGRPLDGATRTEMENRFGADFSDVRIHDDSAAKASAAEVGASAYTSGHHVVLGDGGGDKHTLAHELTHVIQQRRGPVAGTDNGAGLRVSDPSDRFEREAEANARRVMAGSGTAAVAPASVVPAPERGSRPSEGLPIARLMSVEAFKQRSAVKKSIRPSALKKLDAALERFHAIPEQQFSARSQQLETIVQLCLKAQGELKDGPRKDATFDLMNEAATEKNGMALDVAVETAMRQARQEQPIYDCLERYQRRDDESGGFVHLMEANDLLARHAATPDGKDLGVLSALVQDLMSRAVHALTPEQKAYLVGRDLARIEALRDTLTDGTLKRILTEVLTGTDQVNFEAGGAGAKLGGPAGQAYTVKHGLTQPDGTVERTGSLVHELTHVATHRTYGNSAVMLMLPLSMSEAEAIALAKHRTARIGELEALLARESATIAESHTALIRNKLNYAKGDKLSTYVANFRAKLTADGDYERLSQLASRIPEGSSTLVEYDTVLNQLLVMMHEWGTGPESAFRKRVEALAQERYAHRQAGSTEPAPAATV